MALMDMLEEVSARNTAGGRFGEARMWGVAVGIVVENYNKDRPGYIKVRLPLRDEEEGELRWVKAAAPYAGKGWVFFFQPEKDDQVILAFENGSIEKAYILGALSREKDAIRRQSADADNQKKRIVGRNGSEILFWDDKEGGGEKDSITVQTAGERHKIELDNAKQRIVIKDKDANCVVELGTKEGDVKVTAARKLTIKVGDAIQVSMNGDSGEVQVKASKVTVQADNSLALKANGSAKLSGQQTMLEASSMLKLSGSGMVTVSGSPVKLG